MTNTAVHTVPMVHPIYKSYICRENSRDKRMGKVTRQPQECMGMGIHGVGNAG